MDAGTAAHKQRKAERRADDAVRCGDGRTKNGGDQEPRAAAAENRDLPDEELGRCVRVLLNIDDTLCDTRFGLTTFQLKIILVP